MQKTSLTSRFLQPLCLAVTVLIASRAAYFNAHRIDGEALYQAFAVLTGIVHFASVVLVPMVLYPWIYRRGATGPERVAACSVNLALWIAVDTYKVSEAFPWEESLYYGVNIGAILFSWNFAQMGLLELLCRWGEKKREGRDRVVTPLPVLPLLLFLLVVCLLSKEGGAAYFNALLDGYRILFRN